MCKNRAPVRPTIFYIYIQLFSQKNKTGKNKTGKNKTAEEVGASAKRVARPEGPMRATPQGQRGREASDAKNIKAEGPIRGPK
jgi:hypothetical protein